MGRFVLPQSLGPAAKRRRAGSLSGKQMQSGEILLFVLAICSARASRFTKVLLSILDCPHFCVVFELKCGLNPCLAFSQGTSLQRAEQNAVRRVFVGLCTFDQTRQSRICENLGNAPPSLRDGRLGRFPRFESTALVSAIGNGAASRSNPALSKPVTARSSFKAELFNGKRAQRIPSWPGASCSNKGRILSKCSAHRSGSG